ncbi:arrestin domain-containing protein 3-like [Salvelinus namaycush]|uniref:Arrestin domain-containing protein 3-like n=1 Tax=Salvelinus namaycush TaxID=8040 RepID=A0A8U0UIG1_SALNM|nr:arrestin domain-containing protein 3-like [Salvelinus namaycush]
MRHSCSDIDCEIISPGRHVFPFTFQIPDRNIPSTFKARRGNIVYSLEAKLSRSMKVDKTAKTKFTFISKADISLPALMEPQHGTKDKDIVFFASGNISMSIHTEKMGYQQGEAIKILVEIHNNSTRTVTPNFYLYEEQSFFAKHKRKFYTIDIIKERGDPVTASTRQTVTKVLTIPPQLPVSLLDCSILKLEYRLKVTLDVPMAKDPEVTLPLVILLDKSIAAEERQQEYSWSK